MDGHSIHYHVERGAQGIKLNTPAIAAALVDILKRNRDLETTKHTTEWLQCLSRDPAVLLSIYQSNGIPVLVKLLNAPQESVSFYAAKTLRNLLLGQEGSKAAVCKAGGLQKMVMILKNNNEKFLSVVTDCLMLLAYKKPENKLIIFSSDGPAELVRIMETYRCQTLLWTTARVLRVLSACSSNKRAIIAAGGVQALAKHLDNRSQKLVVNCLWTLRNLSDAATKQENVASLLKRLVQLLGSRHKIIVCCTAGILSNMTCNNPRNKVIICQENGIGALVKVILMARNDEEIIEPAICTLRHLTCRHPEAETAQNDVRLHFGLQAIVKFLNPPNRWPLIKAVVGLVRNLTLCRENHELLLELGTVHILKDMLRTVYQNISRNRESLSYYETQPTVIDDVKMEDIVEIVLSAFLKLAGNAKIRTLLKDSNIMNTFIQIMNKENENIQCIVAGIFCEFASDTDGSLTVKSIEDVPFLCYSLRSNNEGLATSGSESRLVPLPHRYEYTTATMGKIIQKVYISWDELLQSSTPSVIVELGDEESRGSVHSSGSRPTSNQGFDLQPMQDSDATPTPSTNCQ